MGALRTLLPGMAVTAMLGAFALTTGFSPPNAACAAPAATQSTTKSSPPLEKAADPAASASSADKTSTPSPAALSALPHDGQPHAAQPTDKSTEMSLGQSALPQAAALPLLSPIRRTAQCPAALPAQAKKQCAEAFALLEALNAAVAALPQHREIRMGIAAANEYPALAAALYSTLVEPAAGTDASASADRGVAVTLLARPNAAARLEALLRNPDALLLRRLLLEEYAATAAMAEKIAADLAETSAAADPNGQATPGAGGTWYVAKATPPGQLTQYAPQPAANEDAAKEAEEQSALRQANDTAADFADRLEATGMALNAMELSSEGWLARADSLAALQQAAQRLPRSAATLVLLAEAQLQAGLPQRSVDSCTQALGLLPDFTRARYIRALAHWRLQQLALAEDDLTVALEKTPGNPLQTVDRSRLLRARGALRMLREDALGMCADLTEACGMGDCEGLAAAREQRFCTPASPAPASPPAAEKHAAPAPSQKEAGQ